MHEQVLKMFCMMFPCYEETGIESYEFIDDMEYIFHIADGSRVIYDDISKFARYLPPRQLCINEVTEEEWKQEFSRKLKKKISFKGTTLKVISENTGIPYRTLMRYSTGERVPDIFSVKKIARELNCDVVKLTNFDYLL